MHEPLYRQAIVHAWRFAWQHKILWILGLLAGVVGHAGLLDFFTYAFSSTRDGVVVLSWSRLVSAVGELIVYVAGVAPADALVWALWLLVILLGLGALFFVVSVISQGALVHASAQSMRYLNLGVVHVDSAWHAGVKHLWSLAIIHGVKKLIITLFGASLGWAAFSILVAPTIGNMILFWLLFLGVLIVGMVVSFLAVYATGYLVVEGYTLLDSIVASWRLFLKHWLVSIEVGALLLCLQVVAGLVAGAGVICFFFPTLVLWVIAVMIQSFALYTIGWYFGFFSFAIFLLFVAAMYSIMVTYSWTYLFMKMHRQGVGSRLLSWWR